MADEQLAPAHSAALMIGARLVNMPIGLLSIPILIRYLGGEAFAAWAILLASGAAFALLEIGMAPTAVRFLALPARDRKWDECRRVLGRMWALLALTFGVGSLAMLAVAQPVAAWLKLPETELFKPEQALCWVLAAVAARAFLQSGTLTLVAARRFEAVAAVSLLQALCSNIAAMVVAWQFRRLDLTLVAYWSAQLCVLAVTCIWTRHMCTPRFGRHTLDAGRLRELCYYGLSNQMEGWAQFVNFQFDKFIVAGMVGLWAVAPYEVANRAVAALRSIPASGADSFLPSAMSRQANREQAWDWYQACTRIAAYSVCMFMLAPLAVAPVFLYAWTGEMGYVGRWAFVALSVGAMASVLALPAATLAQAEGQPKFQARAAAVAILVNVPLSLMLVTQWGLLGAAAGTGVAMTASAALLVYSVHRHVGRSLRATARALATFWPLLLACMCWGAASYVLFGSWFATLDADGRFSRQLRIYPGLLAIAAYVLCVATLVLIEFKRGAFSPQERAWALGLWGARPLVALRRRLGSR